jgi:hypothetical protein
MKNSSVINNNLQAYCNEIIKEVYYIKAHSIKDLKPGLDVEVSDGCEHIETESAKSEFGIKAVVAGYSYREIYILKNYLNTLKQTTLKKTYKIPLIKENIISGYFDGSFLSKATKLSYYSVFSMEVPDGFDGNISFVKVVPDKNKDVSSAGTILSNALVAAFRSALPGTTNNDNAFLYYAPRIYRGAFSIDVAKSKKVINITVDTSGFSDKEKWDYDAYLVVQITFFKRGVR